MPLQLEVSGWGSEPGVWHVGILTNRHVMVSPDVQFVEEMLGLYDTDSDSNSEGYDNRRRRRRGKCEVRPQPRCRPCLMVG